MVIASAFAALVMFAAPDAASAGAPSAEAKPAAEAKAKPRKVCHSERDPGSRLGRTVCVLEPTKDEPKPQAAKSE